MYVREKKRILTPWFDAECRQMKRKVRVLERKYRKSRDAADRLAWITKLQEQTRFHQSKERLYWSTRINANAKNARALWRDLDDLMCRENKSFVNLSAAEAEKQACNFLKFFEQKVESVRSETSKASEPTFQHGADPKFLSFQTTNPHQIMLMIKSSNNKYCALDPLPTAIVKQCSDLLSTYISIMFNRSLTEGYLPPCQKIANVSPRLKKHGSDESDCKNYRPVSNLSFISKLLEQIIAKQLNEFLTANNLLPVHQSAYRRHHSTETGLLKVFSDVCKAIDEGNVCLLGLLDLSAAFDTVDHEILIKRLKTTFGIDGLALQWLNSYLSDRMQTVRVSGKCSAMSKVPHGIPQGSVLGPLLFILYSSPVADIISKHGLMCHSYADDTQIYFYCKPEEMSDLANKFAECTLELEAWMASNRLKLNCEKTEILWLRSRHLQLMPSSIPNVSVGASAVEPSDGARNLGVYFDNNLNMKQHINNVCRQCYFQLRQLRVIRKTLTQPVVKTLLHAFVSSRLDYCNSLFYGLPNCEIKKLQLVQNAAARLFGGLRKFDHITPVLRNDLHWLPIKFRIDYKIALLVFKSLHNIAPSYLTEMFEQAEHSKFLCRNRSASNGDLIQPRWNTVSYGLRDFRYSSVNVWNKLPVTLRKCSSSTTFIKDLKTYLFNRAYN